MSGTSLWVTQQAVYARLSGDATLTAMASVYDAVPDGAAYPYVVIGEATEVANDTMGTTGRDATVTVHIWSQYAGQKESLQILDRVDALLDRWAPTLDGWNAVQMQQEFTETFRDPDGVTRHTVARYRAYAHQ